MAQQAPSPSHILRVHSSQVNTVFFSDDNERLYSADLSGKVIVTSTRSLRSITEWQAHTDGLLGVQEWGENIITHGRDNKLHVWTRVVAQASVGDTAVRSELVTPELRYSLDVNALNFCRFSLLSVNQLITSAPSSSSAPAPSEIAFIALPNLVESSLADVWELPSRRRLHAAIGKLEELKRGKGLDPEGRNGSGILMSLHLFEKPTSSSPKVLHLLSAYESGEVMLRRYINSSRETSIEGRGWECLWKCKEHVESVMAMIVNHDCSFALTTSADHFIVKYNLSTERSIENRFPGNHEKHDDLNNIQPIKYRTKQSGNGAISLRDDDRVCAVGGWDGKIRLYSTKSFKPLGSLTYHSKSCLSVAFAHSQLQSSRKSRHDAEDDDDEMTEEEKEVRSRWLAAGSQDNRLSIWELSDFRKDSPR